MGRLGPGDIHHALTQGPGTGSLQDARAASTSLAQTHEQRESQAMALVMKMGSAWTGDASEAAQAGAAPLLRAFRDGQRALSTHQDLMGRQTESFGVAKTSVHDVPNEPPSASFGDMLSDASGVSMFTGGGYLNKVQDWSEKANANVAAYNGYANASSYNRTNLPNEYGDPSGSGSDIALAPTQPGPGGHGPDGSGGIDGPGGQGGANHLVTHYGPGPSSAWTPPGDGTPGPGTGGIPVQGTGPGQGAPGSGTGSTTTQGWPGGPSSPGAGPGTGPGGGWPTPPGGGGGQGWGSGGEGSFPGGTPFGAPGGGFGSGAGGTAGGGSAGGAKGFRTGGMPGVNAAEGQTGPGARAGAGAPGANAAIATGRPGAPGAPGNGGMAAGAGRGGKKEEDQEHKS
ncbi:glycine-rich cell wall structural protein, partial [Kutzneria sp. 744]